MEEELKRLRRENLITLSVYLIDTKFLTLPLKNINLINYISINTVFFSNALILTSSISFETLYTK